MNDLYSIIVIHLFESTDWAILFLGIVYLLRIKDARVRCWIYRLSLLKFLVPTTLFASWLTFERSGELLSSFIVSAGPVISAVQYTTEQSFFAYPIYFWLAGFCCLFILAWITGVRVHRCIQNGCLPFSVADEARLNKTLTSMGRTQGSLPGMLVSHGPSIALYGLFRPRIIAKRAFLETLDDDELVSAYQHEIAHWMRRDNLWRLLTDVVTAVFWFHPLVWFIRKRLTLETEKACDETVLASGKQADRYASCLLKAAEFSQEENYFGAIALSETSLKQRVSHVIQYKKERVSIMKKSAIILTCLSLFGWSLVAFAETSQNDANRIYEISELDKAPVPLVRVAPVYPPELKKERIQGSVNVVFIVSELGNVDSMSIEKSSNAEFNESALTGVAQWKFEPGLKEGEPVKTRVRLPLSFALREPKEKE